MIEFLKAKCKNKKGLSEANLSKYLKKPKSKNEEKQKNISQKIVKKMMFLKLKRVQLNKIY